MQSQSQNWDENQSHNLSLKRDPNNPCLNHVTSPMTKLSLIKVTVSVSKEDKTQPNTGHETHRSPLEQARTTKLNQTCGILEPKSRCYV